MQTSVIMPVLNGMPFIISAIQSVLDQTVPADEVLVVVDQATQDDTRQAVLTHFHDRVQLVESDGTGVAVTFNTGLARAGGEWILWQDADDVSDADRLAVLRFHAEQLPDHGVIGSRCRFIDDQGAPFASAWTRDVRTNLDGVTQWQDIDAVLPVRCCLFPATTMMRRGVLEDANGLDPRVVVKPAYHLLRRLVGLVRMHKVPTDLYSYRQHAGQSTRR